MSNINDSQILNGNFFSPSMGNLEFSGVIKEIYNYIQEQPEFFYDIVVGCDSPSSDKPFFPIAIVVLRTGAGGRFFLKKMHYPDNFLKKFANINWKNRILQEVYLSCELALSLRETLEKEFGKATPTFNYQFQYIHADVGEQGKTKEMVKEVVGLIRSNGFEPRIKPQSFAASVVADRYT
ncbi:MAG: ribonuclease H-like YkuK family protein [bacterium]|nr:ribonuclease H-like YkuK family protein [bacterium]